MANQAFWQTIRLVSFLLLSAATIIAPAAAQSWPSAPIRIVVSGGAGAPPDIITRIVANELMQSEGWRIVVENKPGAITTLAAGEVLKQPPDGHSIFVFSMGASAAPALLSNAPFRYDTEFAPVIKLMTVHNVLVVNPSVPATSMGELVALLKSQPDKLRYSSGGNGTPAHLVGEQFRLRTGVSVTHVPYRALPQAIGDLLNGTNHYQFITPLPVLELISSGKLRALAVTASKRLTTLPDIPTVVEAGFSELVTEDWLGFVVKSGTPDVIVSSLNQAVNRALAKPAVREAFAKIAAEPAGGTAAEFGTHIQAQLAHWAKVIKDAGIRPLE